MVIKLADNIYSPLGATTWENYQAVMAGKCALKQYSLPDGSLYTASLFPEEQRHDDDTNTFFEQLCIASASDAIARAGIDPSSPRCRFFLSTTKGNVHLLADGGTKRALLGTSAEIIRRHFGNPNHAVVVSNACISGLSAQIVAMRSIEVGLCDTAIVIGCDVQSEFIISGFQCLHALSPDECRPFDKDRCGLNLGEAAATIVYANSQFPILNSQFRWQAANGVMCNDANHISGPSRTGEGSYRCLQALGIDKEQLAFVSVHGTSTLYNDEMESIAIDRAGLADVPLFSLKGIYGHTMGAAGVLETILSMQAVEHGVIFGTRGYHELGVSRQVNISTDNRTTDKHSFVKLLSGFGGCNAAMKFCYNTHIDHTKTIPSNPSIGSISSIQISPSADELVDLYRTNINIGDYPKFFKMDPLSRLGFVATELLLKQCPKADYGVLLFNRSSSLADDLAFQATIQDHTNWFPSPALFVYTLPNIVTGEIAIRNHFQTETNFMVLDAPHTDIMAAQIAIAAMHGPQIAGWCDVDADGNYLAALVAVPQDTPKEIIEQELNKILK